MTRPAKKGKGGSQSICAMTKEEQCSFEIKICLEVGKHWCILRQLALHGIHNHAPFNDQAERAPMASFSQEQREVFFHFSARSATAEPASIWLSTAQAGSLQPQLLLRNRQFEENGGKELKLTAAQKLVNHLKKEVRKKRMRRVNLFHNVTETTPLGHFRVRSQGTS